MLSKKDMNAFLIKTDVLSVYTQTPNRVHWYCIVLNSKSDKLSNVPWQSIQLHNVYIQIKKLVPLYFL